MTNYVALRTDRTLRSKGRALFSGVNNRLSLDLVKAKSTESVSVVVIWRIVNVANFEGVSDLVPAYEAEGRCDTHDRNTRRAASTRLELLEAEKDLTRRPSHEIARRRRELPWVRIEGKYRFETDEGERLAGRPLPGVPGTIRVDVAARTSQLRIRPEHRAFGTRRGEHGISAASLCQSRPTSLSTD